MTEQAGDSFVNCKYTHDFQKDPSNYEPKVSYTFVMEAEISKLKYALDNWKQIALHAKNILLWEQQWHPTALIGGSTILFTLLWLLEPSILTVISILGLIVTISDYLAPTIAKSFFKSEKWTARKDQEFEELCTKIVLFKARVALLWGRYYRLKATNSKLYFGLTITTLMTLAWIGCTFNNLFLAYVLVSLLLLLPGMEHSGFTAKYSESITNFVTELLKQKSKAVEKTD